MLRYAERKGQAMAYRFGNREQLGLLPSSIEEYVSAEDPVRVYDAFVESLNFTELGIEVDEDQVGNPEYDPKAMMKLLVYGYSYGVKGSRKLERECHHNLSFLWLMGGLKPDHKTIAEYRRRYKGALTKVLKQCVRLCIKLDLIAGNVLFVDGTKIRANAGRGKSHGREWYDKKLQELDERIEQLLAESERIDQEQESEGSSVKMNQELAQAERFKEKIKRALKAMEESGREKINLTDPTVRDHAQCAREPCQLQCAECGRRPARADCACRSGPRHQRCQPVCPSDRRSETGIRQAVSSGVRGCGVCGHRRVKEDRRARDQSGGSLSTSGVA